ncbi:PAS domain S-box-containing protein [Dehalogenimonas formicexedens]|uniref:Oxygen sensor histidine kinase NreB n=1 Tax=Dehalogenimonas formicexedens TaxID=1839801 RepID=A0A1P8F7P6_9CHLR|nr:PAS domain S-box protein [Dehalogenimonas formicexedens]APV44499.1 PAS domain S-box-containing protein [Dehalogenimonas formicexedens]
MKKKKSSLPDQDYRYLFENASDAIWVQDLEGQILYANKAAERLTGYGHDELVNHDVIKFLPDVRSHDIAREVRRRLTAGEDFHQPYEQRIVRSDGTLAIWRMATSLVIVDGEVKGFQHIARDITAEKQLQDNMRFYVQEVIRAQEDERKRVARELHDEVSPSLLLLIQRIDAITSNNRLKLSEVMKEKMEDLRVQTVEALESTRRIAQDLRPRILDDLGLIPALEWMADNLIKKHGIEAKVTVAGREQLLSSEVQLLLFRIAQEALNNIRKHSEASQVEITVTFGDEKTVVSIADNGKGFAIPHRVSDLAAGGKLGLAGMQERAQLIGGHVALKSDPGHGTVVTVEVPNQGNLCEIPTPAQELERRLRT